MNEGKLILPHDYENKLDYVSTEIAIKYVKDLFERRLAYHLNLMRVSAPLFVRKDSGLNDNLNGVERPVTFDIRDIEGDVEIVQSLAKWKRMALYRYGFLPGEGLYTDMNAIRRDEISTTCIPSMSISGTGKRSSLRKTARWIICRRP